MSIYYIHAEDANATDNHCGLFVDAKDALQALHVWLPYAKLNFAEEIELCSLFELPTPQAGCKPKVLEWNDLDGVPDLLSLDAELLDYAKDLVKRGIIHSLHRRHS